MCIQNASLITLPIYQISTYIDNYAYLTKWYDLIICLIQQDLTLCIALFTPLVYYFATPKGFSFQHTKLAMLPDGSPEPMLKFDMHHINI